MKSFNLLVIYLCASTCIQSQPTLVKHLNYDIGDKVYFYTCDSSTYSAKGAGSSYTWDYSTLSIKDSFQIEIADKSKTPDGNKFPQASFAEQANSATSYVINKTDSYSLNGIVAGSTIIEYTNPQLLLRRPFTFNDVVNDTFSVSYLASAFNVTGTGESTTIADGYGTLILPNGTYNNVLRVRNEFSRDDTIQGVPPPSNLIQNSGVVIIWFDTMHRAPLMRVDSIVYTSSVFSGERVSVSILKNEEPLSVVNSQQLEKSIKVYASAGTVHISELDRDKPYRLYIHNSMGQLVWDGDIKTSSGKYTSHIKELCTGMYILKVADMDGSMTVKFFNN